MNETALPVFGVQTYGHTPQPQQRTAAHAPSALPAEAHAHTHTHARHTSLAFAASHKTAGPSLPAAMTIMTAQLPMAGGHGTGLHRANTHHRLLAIRSAAESGRFLPLLGGVVKDVRPGSAMPREAKIQLAGGRG